MNRTPGGGGGWEEGGGGGGEGGGGEGEGEETQAYDERGIVRYRRKSNGHSPSDDLRDLWAWVVLPILEAIGYTVEL